MMPTEKIQSLQQFKKTEKDVIGGLCRCVMTLSSYGCVFGSQMRGVISLASIHMYNNIGSMLFMISC